MDEPGEDLTMTRDELAELYGVAPVTVDEWTRQGMPMIGGGAPLTDDPRPPRAWRITRRDLARLFDWHPDTLTKKLSEGLGAAVVERGPRGSDLVFDLRLAFRWWLASEKRLDAIVLDDFRAQSRRGVLALSQLSPVGMLITARDE